MTVIAEDGYMPSFLAKRKNSIPLYSIITMSLFAYSLILIGNLEVILEFGSITFLLVSLLMAVANLKIYKKTNSSLYITIVSLLGLILGACLILYYEFTNKIEQMYFICLIYILLTIASWLYSKFHSKKL